MCVIRYVVWSKKQFFICPLPSTTSLFQTENVMKSNVDIEQTHTKFPTIYMHFACLDATCADKLRVLTKTAPRVHLKIFLRHSFEVRESVKSD